MTQKRLDRKIDRFMVKHPGTGLTRAWITELVLRLHNDDVMLVTALGLTVLVAIVAFGAGYLFGIQHALSTIHIHGGS